jgi:RND family efflux transporter MFP subunit
MKLTTVAGIALSTLVLAACSEKAPPPEPPRPVATMIVKAGSADSKRSFAGEVRARYETPLGFRIGGKLQRRLVDAGDPVKAGQPIALLDPADVVLELAQAEAQLAQAEAEYKRYVDMREKNFISQSALDEREAAYKAALARAGLARNAQEYATLRADASGVIAATLAEPGQVLAAGEPVVVLARAGEREVATSLPESSVGFYRLGDLAEVRLWAAGDKIYHGKVREIAAAADPATRTYPTRITLLDADEAVVLGMSGHVDFVAKQENSLVVPATAIYQQGEQPAVWVVDDKDTTVLRPVNVESWRDGGVLVTSGLEPGERIVASGVHKVHAGEKVSFKDID